MAISIRKDSPLPSPRPQRIAFDNFEVDLRSGEIRKNGARIRLQAQPFQLLALLLVNASEVVSRDEVCRELWPADTFVDFEHSLAAAVNKIRDALGDSADNPKYIETLPKRGYRFIGKIKPNPPVDIKVTEQQRPQGASEPRPALEAITPAAANAPAAPLRRNWVAISAGALALILLAAGAVAWLRAKRSPPRAASQEPSIQAASQQGLMELTDFADSAVSPALSLDGRILAFIRGPDTFMGSGQIYAKLLPDGAPVQLTHDTLAKMSPQFSSDGSTIFYTVFALGEFNTWTVSLLGGEPRLRFPNTEGLTWIDSGHFLFSEFVSGIHMAIVTSTSTRDQIRQVYLPPRERGMAHRSALSPDRKWVLLVEMDNGGWLPCRLVPFDASSPSKPVGPQGAACTYVAWSPDQAWMYFSSNAGGRFHIWRQRFPNGEPQQLTSGATEEEGVAVAPDGASLITSVGLAQSTLWVRDAKGERQISSEGYAESPEFSRDGKKLYYLVHRKGASGQSSSRELWVADLEAGRNARLLPDTLVSENDVSPDGTQVVFSAADSENRSHLWLASLNFSFPPRQFISPVNEDEPHWDSTGYIYFRAAEGKLNFLYRMRPDGSERVRLLPQPILDIQAVSPNGRWAIVAQAESEGPAGRILAIPLDGGTPVAVCAGYCVGQWTSDEKFFSVIMSTSVGTETLVAPVSRPRNLPSLPPTGIASNADMHNMRDAKVVDGTILWGPKPGLSATLHQDVHRNLYRVALQ
jgi:DNA-binding winged helix-turn-helix (wHTH) protein/Tol biopolymer transport system component